MARGALRYKSFSVDYVACLLDIYLMKSERERGPTKRLLSDRLLDGMLFDLKPTERDLG